MELFKEILNQLNFLHLIKKTNRDWNDDIVIYLYVITFVYILIKATVRWIDRVVPPPEMEDLYIRRSYARRVYIILCIMVALPVFYSRLDFIPTFIGISGAAIIITSREMILSIVSWFIIRSNEGFEIGDRIEVDGVRGDVVNIGVLRFSVLEVNKEVTVDQSTNRIVHFPNNFVILQKIFVVHQKMDYIWDELNFHITLDSNLSKVESLSIEVLNKLFLSEIQNIEEKLKEVSKNYLVKLGKTTPIVYTCLDNNKVLVTLRYLTPLKHKRPNRSLLTKEILSILKKEADIKFT